MKCIYHLRKYIRCIVMLVLFVLFRPVFSNPKSIQASVTLLEKLPVILDKSTEEDMRNLVLPLLFNSLESKMSQIQVRLAKITYLHLETNNNLGQDQILLILYEYMAYYETVMISIHNKEVKL